MQEKTLEAFVASPPDRDDLVVQLFVKDGGQWGEVLEESGQLVVELYQHLGSEVLRLPLADLTEQSLATTLHSLGWDVNSSEAYSVLVLAAKELVGRQA